MESFNEKLQRKITETSPVGVPLIIPWVTWTKKTAPCLTGKSLRTPIFSRNADRWNKFSYASNFPRRPWIRLQLDLKSAGNKSNGRVIYHFWHHYNHMLPWGQGAFYLNSVLLDRLINVSLLKVRVRFCMFSRGINVFEGKSTFQREYWSDKLCYCWGCL